MSDRTCQFQTETSVTTLISDEENGETKVSRTSALCHLGMFILIGLPVNEVVPRLKEKVTDFKGVMPCITSLRNPSLKSRHWEQIENIIQKSIARDKNFTLGNLLEMNVSSTSSLMFSLVIYLIRVRNTLIMKIILLVDY